MQTPVSSCSRRRRRKWIALDSPQKRCTAQAEHARICSDSSPAQAVPQIFCNAHQGRAPPRGCGLPLPEVSIHLEKRDHATDSAQLQTIEPVKPDFCVQVLVVQGSKAVPIALCGSKQASISTCNVRCSGAELVSLGAHLHTTPQQPQH